MSHDLTWLDRINCCFNCVTVYTNPCLAWQLKIFPIGIGKYENMAEALVYNTCQYYWQRHMYIPRTRICFICRSHLLSCPLNFFPSMHKSLPTKSSHLRGGDAPSRSWEILEKLEDPQWREDSHSEFLLSMKEHWKPTENHWDRLIQMFLRYAGLLFGKRTAGMKRGRYWNPEFWFQEAWLLFRIRLLNTTIHAMIIIVTMIDCKSHYNFQTSVL